MEFVAATNNAKKMEEIKRILENLGHSVLSQKEAGITIEPEENATTFEGNALIKAREIALVANKPVIADDSGLCVTALDGAPGVYSARYCGRHGDDDANNVKLLQEMQNVHAGERNAKFVSCICVYLPQEGKEGRYMTVEGECPGQIGFECVGDNGFGYDPLFIPNFVGVEKHGTKKEQNIQNRTYAQLTADEKDAISHRGSAMRQMQEKLDDFLKIVPTLSK